MRRALVLFSAFCAALLAVAPSGNAGAVGAEPTPVPTIESVTLKLRVHGFIVHLQVSEGSEGAALIVWKRGEIVEYGTKKGQLEGRTVSADFGRLGSLDMTLQGPLRHAKRCGGRSETAGAFKGSFDFNGERGYLRFHRDVVHGEAETVASCPVPDPAARAFAARETGREEVEREEARREREDAEREAIVEPHATLAAVAHGHGSVGREVLLAYGSREPRGRFDGVISATRTEHRDGIQILRGALLALRHRSSLDWDLAEGTATLRPPAPFLGSATFLRRPGGKPRWTGNLRVPTLGGRPMFLTGKRFRTVLRAELPKIEDESRPVEVGSGALPLP